MKFLKNNLKVIIAFILGLILAGGIVYAATSAKDVTYTTAKNGSIKNVEEALNDLYNKNTDKQFYRTFTPSNSEYVNFDIGFIPSKIIVVNRGGIEITSDIETYIYDSSINQSTIIRYGYAPGWPVAKENLDIYSNGYVYLTGTEIHIKAASDINYSNNGFVIAIK